MTDQISIPMPRQTKTLLIESVTGLACCMCGGHPVSIESFINGRKAIILMCNSCKKSTPILIRDLAVRYWNQIAKKEILQRELIYNEWGVCKSDSCNTIIETHGKNSIRIRVYFDKNIWFYGFNIHIGNLIRTKQPVITDCTFNSLYDSKVAAKEEIKRLCEIDKKTKKSFLDFTVISNNQLDLFAFRDEYRRTEAY